MQQAVRGEHARVAKQAASTREVERLTGEIGNTSTGLLDQECASRLIPDCVVEPGVGWKAHQQIADARSDLERRVDALVATEASRFDDALSSHRAADHAARLRQLADRLRGGVAG